MTNSPGDPTLDPARRAQAWLKRMFGAGLVVLAPIGLTVYVLHGIIASADAVFAALPDALSVHRFPGAGLLVALLTVLAAGFVARNLVGRLLLTALSRVVERIPVVATLYKLLRQISEAFLGGGSGAGFQRVVLVEWPRRELWTLAFVTSELRGELADELAAASVGGRPAADGPLLNLFIPTTPNPTGGFHCIARADDCRPTGLTVEAAFKIIISGGALTPDAVSSAR